MPKYITMGVLEQQVCYKIGQNDDPCEPCETKKQWALKSRTFLEIQIVVLSSYMCRQLE